MSGYQVTPYNKKMARVDGDGRRADGWGWQVRHNEDLIGHCDAIYPSSGLAIQNAEYFRDCFHAAMIKVDAKTMEQPPEGAA